MKSAAFICIVIHCIIHSAQASPVNHKPVATSNVQHIDKNIEEHVKQQVDAVKQIVSHQNHEIRHQNHDTRSPYPQVTKYGPSDKPVHPHGEEKNETLEELQTKCLYHFKFFNATQPNDRLTAESRIDKPAHSPHRPQYHPAYVQAKNHTTSHVQHTTPRHRHTSAPPTRGHYITQPTPKPTTDSTEIPENIKFIKLEPVILQKTVLSDGRIIYYWHKSLPSAVEYPQHPAYYDPQRYAPDNLPSAPTVYQKSNYNTPSITTPTTTTTTTTSTTTPSSSWSFRDYLMWSSGSSEPARNEATTQKPTVAPPSTTTVVPPTDANADPLYANQLRFIIPVPYEDPANVTRDMWEFDQFAYYPEHMQPSTVKVKVPYVPTFHMIKALAVPNQYSNLGNPDAYGGYYQKAR